MNTSRIAAPQGSASDLNILLVDDHILISETIALSLKSDASIKLDCTESIDGAEDHITQKGKYNVVLLDYDVPGMNGFDGFRKLMQLNDGNVALFSGVASRNIVARALGMGAVGFIPKTLPLRTLKHAIRFMSDGEIFIPADFARMGAWETNDTKGLKPREMKVLVHLCEGMQNKEISRVMELPESIVKLDVKSICRKLGAKNRTQAVLEARKQGLM